MRRGNGRFPRRMLAFIGGVAVVAAGTAAAQLAGNSGGASYTGCLTPGGTLVSIAVGDSPLNSCGMGSRLAHFGSSGIALFASRQPEIIVLPDNLANTPILGLDVPAGTFSITAVGEMDGPFADTSMGCSLIAGTTTLSVGGGHSHDYVGFANIAMMALPTFDAPTHLQITCSTHYRGVEARFFAIQAIKVD